MLFLSLDCVYYVLFILFIFLLRPVYSGFVVVTMMVEEGSTATHLTSSRAFGGARGCVRVSEGKIYSPV